MNPDMTPTQENKSNKTDVTHDTIKFFVIEPMGDMIYGTNSKKDAMQKAKACLLEDAYAEVYVCEAIVKVTCVPKIEKI